MDDDDRSGDNIASEFNTYEDYLDSNINPLDLYYLEDEELARQLVELGIKGSGEVLSREEFNERKAEEEAKRLAMLAPPRTFMKACHRTQDPFLCALAMRDEGNRNGKMNTIIFVRDLTSKGQEVSAYIDFAHRLKHDGRNEDYFNGKKRILPRHSDLSYYNWDIQRISMNSSPNWEVIAENAKGLLFRNKRDRKILNVDPEAPSPGDNSTRSTVATSKYQHVVFYDHVTRRTT